MRTKREEQERMRILAGILAVVLVMAFGILVKPFGMTAHAQSEGKVTAASAKIRKEPSTTSEVAGSAEKDASVTINFQTKASDGTTWYQIFIDANTLGYIRSDLVQITDGTTPSTQSVTTTAPAATTAPTIAPTTAPTATPVVNETPADVTAVNPVSASVAGGQSVRVRANASTSSQIVTTVQNGLALTVTGQTNGTDGNVWYQVTFIDNGSQVTGFIRMDYVSLTEELVPVTEEVVPEDTPEDTEPIEEPVEDKVYDTQEQDGKWYLIVKSDNPDGNEAGQYEIKQIFDSVDNNAKIAENSLKTVKNQKIVIIVLVIFMVVLAGAVVLLIMKLRENADSAYFSEVERDTMRRKSSGGKPSMPTVGAGKGTGNRPAGARPAGGRAGAPQGSRPAGAPQGSRPAGAPQGGRPAGTPQGSRPAGTPQGSRPAGTPQGSRPAGAPQGGRPAGAPQGSRSTGARPTARPSGKEDIKGQQQTNPGWKSKNFMNEDDEFEFEFLNWDGDEET